MKWVHFEDSKSLTNEDILVINQLIPNCETTSSVILTLKKGTKVSFSETTKLWNEGKVHHFIAEISNECGAYRIHLNNFQVYKE